jgi:hypothetical protein
MAAEEEAAAVVAGATTADTHNNNNNNNNNKHHLLPQLKHKQKKAPRILRGPLSNDHLTQRPFLCLPLCLRARIWHRWRRKAMGREEGGLGLLGVEGQMWRRRRI